MSDENTTPDSSDTESSEDDDAQRQLAEASQNEGDDSSQDETSDGKDWKSDAERWKSQSRKNESDLKALQKKLREIEDKDKSESQRLADQLAEREVELSELRVAQVRRDAAEAADLPASFTKFISATDPGEALAQAKELAKAVVKATDEQPKPPTKTDFRQGVRGTAPKPTGDKNELIRRMAGFG